MPRKLTAACRVVPSHCYPDSESTGSLTAVGSLTNSPCTSSPIGYDKYENSKLAKKASLTENCGIQDHTGIVEDAIQTR